MKKTILILMGLAMSLFVTSCNSETKEDTAATDSLSTEEVVEDSTAQAEVIKLVEVPGAFETTELKLKAGQPYTFEVSNKGIDKEVAFVLAPAPTDPKISTDSLMKTAIADAMLPGTIKKDETASSKAPVTLEKGEYIYFCPLNGTPQYKVTVE